MAFASFALAQTIAPSPGQATTTTTPAEPNHAAPPAADMGPLGWLGTAGPLLIFIPLIAMMLWTSRSQQKRQQKVLSELKKGDTVLTQGGLRGKLLEMGDRFAKVEIAPGTKVEILKSAVLGKDGAEAAAQIEKK
jgi:preprotein translocase subunit YajC